MAIMKGSGGARHLDREVLSDPGADANLLSNWVSGAASLSPYIGSEGTNDGNLPARLDPRLDWRYLSRLPEESSTAVGLLT